MTLFSEWTIGKRLMAGFAISALTLAAVAGLSYFNIGQLIENVRWVEHTYDVRSKWRRLLAEMADIETGSRGYVITGDESFLEPYLAGNKSAKETLQELRELTADNTNQQKRLTTLAPLIDTYLSTAAQIVEARRTGGFEPAAKMVAAHMGKQHMDRIRAIVAEADQEEDSLLNRRSEEAKAAAETVKLFVIWGGIIGTLAVVIIGMFITRSLSRLVDEIASAATSLSSATAEILAATTQQASATTEETTAVRQTAATILEVRQTAEAAVRKTRNVAELSQRAAETAERGRQSVDETVRSSASAKSRIEALAERILAFSEQAQAIADLNETVDELAEQSNLLAVNASIEAAKAGDAGKGFAVVASEVRELADRSKEAIAHVRGIVVEIQKSAQAAVLAAEQGVKAADEGTAVARSSGDAIGTLTASVEEASQAAQQILAAADQQETGIQQISLAMQNIEQSSTQTVAATKQVERAARDLDHLSKQLATLVKVVSRRIPDAAVTSEPLRRAS